MNHSEFYGDVSYAFNLPALETLILDKSSFEVKFDRLQDNPALKALSLNHVKLYKNIEMWSDGMVRSINYDDVLLDEYTSFFRPLSLAGIFEPSGKPAHGSSVCSRS